MVRSEKGDANAFYNHAWGMYRKDLKTELGLELKISPVPTIPYSSNGGKAATLTFFPFYMLEARSGVDMRILAPAGYIYHDGKIKTTAGAEAWPVSTYQGKETSELVFTDLTFGKGKTSYGFNVDVRVPSQRPTRSADAFFVELGFKQSSIQKSSVYREMATVLEAPPMAALLNCAVGFQTNLAGYFYNSLEFTFELATTLTSGQGLIIKGKDLTDQYDLNCGVNAPSIVALTEEGSLPFPSGLQCVADAGTDFRPRVRLVVNEEPMVKGMYKFEVRAQNPQEPISQLNVWEFETAYSPYDFPNTERVDQKQRVYGFKVNKDRSSVE
jgi:hypothetical protein